MSKVLEVDFGQWNDTVFWLVEYLQSKYGPVCVYRPEGMPNQLRAAYYPPARNSPGFTETAREGYGVFVMISTRAKGAPVVSRPTGAQTSPKRMPINNSKAPSLIDAWFKEAKPK